MRNGDTIAKPAPFCKHRGIGTEFFAQKRRDAEKAGRVRRRTGMSTNTGKLWHIPGPGVYQGD